MRHPPLQCFTTQMACVAYQYHSLSVQTIPTHTDSLKRLQRPIFLHEQFSPLDGYKAVDHFNQQTRAYRTSRKIPTSIILSIIKSNTITREDICIHYFLKYFISNKILLNSRRYFMYIECVHKILQKNYSQITCEKRGIKKVS